MKSYAEFRIVRSEVGERERNEDLIDFAVHNQSAFRKASSGWSAWKLRAV
jgi:hypothetical protein